MKIELKQLRIKNFKGVLDMTIEFTSNTIIRGNNATGKTTVFDAFSWLLNGKDSTDRKDFNIKNTDKKEYNRADHEVEGYLVVDNKDFILKRVYREKWEKKKGSPVAEFTGHETIFFVNDVPCSQKEYQAKVGDVCSEDLFKLITNPQYFPAMKWQAQREILFGMAGEVKDADIAEGNESFMKLLAVLSGKTLDEFKREIAAKKKRIKDELDFIPGRIDEVSRNMPVASNFEILAIQLNHKKSDLEKIEAQIADISKAAEAQYKAKQELQTELYGVKSQQQKIKHEANEKAEAQKNQSGAARRDLLASIERMSSRITTTKTAIEDWNRKIDIHSKQREALIEKWHVENNKTLVFNEQDFCCPTCKRAFDMSDIESKQAEMTANFNNNKAKALELITNDGKAVKTLIDQETAALKQSETALDGLNSEMAELNNNLKLIPDQPTEVVTLSQFDIEGLSVLEDKIIALQAKIDEPIASKNTEEITATKTSLISEIDGLKKKLYEKELIEKSNLRIDELKEQQRSMSNEIAQLEGLEFTIMEFIKAKVEMIEERVNSLFKIVRFRLFETQVNGQEVETCVAMVDNVPYPDLNNAKKINAGLDIINTISNYRNVFAPVFIDNAEAVVKLIPIDTQSVQLVVANQEFEIINN